MNNIFFRLIIITGLFISAISCSNDKLDSGGELRKNGAVIIETGIGSRAYDSTWETGDAIGVTMYNADSTEMINGVYNTEYVTNDPLGLFEAIDVSEILYFPQNGDRVRIKSYYPYTASLGSDMLLPWTVTDQSVLRDIDLMTSVHTAGYSKEDTEVELLFHHRLSKLIFLLSVEDDGDFVSLADCELTIHGMETGNTYNLFADEFINASQGINDIDVPRRTGESEDYRQAIVLPREAGEGVIFEFLTPDGDTYIAYMSETLELKRGNQYTFVLTLSKNPITISATIQPWVDNDPISYETLLVSTPAGASSGVAIGDSLNVYLQNEDATAFEFLRKFNYESENNWVPTSPVYWEDIEQDPAVFRASTVVSNRLNSTQLPDILIADELSVARHTGANFTLRHAASKVTISLLSDTFDDTDLQNATITLPNYLIGGYEEAGKFVEGTQRGNILVDRSDVDNGIALFQPQTIPASTTLLTITINDRDYNVEQDTDFTFEEGVNYQIIVTLNKEGLTISVTVVDWEEETINLTAVTIGTPVSGGENVNDGDELVVYYGNEEARTYLNSYTYSLADDEFTSGTTSYWEALPDPSTFYAYIARPGYGGTNQIAQDYLVASPVTVSASNGVHFELTHAEARVAVVVTSNDGTFSPAELAAMNFILPNYEIGATMNNGVFVPGNVTGNISVSNDVVDENGDTRNLALIQSQTIPSGTTVLQVKSPTRTYNATYDQDITYEAGMTTVLEVDLSKTEITMSANVIDWSQEYISLTPEAIEVGGTLRNTIDFFKDKTIYIYDINNPDEYYTYTYQELEGKYQWEGPVLYWDDQPNQSINWTAVYYPSNMEPAQNNTFDWMIAANQNEDANDYYGNYDLLAARRNLARPEYVNFAFEHKTAKVTINLVPGVGFTVADLQDAVIVLNDYDLDGVFNVATGAFTSTSGTDDVTPWTETNGVKYSALVMPQTKDAGSTLMTITLAEYPNTPFVGAIADKDISFISGRETVITVTLNRTEIVLSANVVDWQKGDTGNITID